MRLLRLHMKGFGKFKDKSLDLNKGINLVYGQNEAGKTTIHAFIEGMLYGFTDGTKKRKTYTDDHEKYRPREGAYQGTMEFEFKGKAYRLERNFEKKQTDVRLFEKDSGRDITADHPVHPVRKEIDLARFLDMPRTLFKNTLSISQMNAATDESARHELLRRLQNISQTKSETLSISRALSTIEEEEKAIGSDRAPKRPYLRTKEKLGNLKEEYDAAKHAHLETLEEKRRLDEISEEDEKLNKERAQYERELKQIDNTKRLNRYHAIEEKRMDIQKTLEHSSDTPPDVTVRFLDRTFKDYEGLFKRLEDAREEVLDKTSRLNSLKDRLPEKGSLLEKTSLQEIEADHRRVKTFLRDRQEALKTRRTLEEEASSNETMLKDKKARHAFWKKGLIFGLPLVWAASITGAILPFFMLGAWQYFLILIIPVLITCVNLVATKRNKKLILSLEKALDNLKIELDKAAKTHDMNDKELTRLLEAYGVDTPEGFDKFYYEASYKKDAQKKTSELMNELEDIKKTFSPLLSRFALDKDTDRLKPTFDALRAIKTSYDEMKRLLEGEAFETFESSIDFSLKTVDTTREETVREAFDWVERTLRENALERSKKEGNVASMEKNHRPLSTIDYDIKKTEEALQGLEKQKRILAKASKRLKDVQKTIEDQFAPIMNENTEGYLKTLTDGVYDSIKMKKDLSFNVLSKETGRLEHARFFSAGTLDQIYIAMRLGILKTLKKGHLPLFMDDPFVQFDKARLKEALKLINAVAKERQVLLFTCHERENSTLDALKIPYTHHALT